MGCAESKRGEEVRAQTPQSRVISARVLALEEEIRETRRSRLKEFCAHRRHEADLARRHDEVVSALKRRLAEEEGRRRALEEAAAAPAHRGGSGIEGVKKELRWLAGASRLAERVVKAERAAERWKQLYLAIKAELDGLILRTKQGERLCWTAGGDVVGRLRIELKAKDETIQRLRSRLEATEKEKAERERQIDIMKQSLRILSCSRSRRSSSSCCRNNLARIMRRHHG